MSRAEQPTFHEATPRAAVFGCAGTVLSEEERRFFREANPLGFILFGRNCHSPDQLRDLVEDLKSCVRWPSPPILIDQEGGRVARLGPPHWRKAPPAAVFGSLARRAPGDAVEAAQVNASLIGRELFELGISVDCAPVLDVPAPGAHDVIGDRALDTDPHVVGLLGRAVCESLLDSGVIPVIKHIPGHGRATSDSHVGLPAVTTRLSELEESDFVPFRMLNDMPWAMTAHVLFTAVDGERPATVSPKVIEECIRGDIGFDGLLITDDICMAALAGGPGARAAAALAAGCDVVLHCNGEMAEMVEVAAATGAMTEAALQRLERGEAMRDVAPAALDPQWAARRLDDLLAAA